MIDHTIVGWNGSVASRRAAEWAVGRAARTRGAVGLVHVLPWAPEEAGDVAVADAVAGVNNEVTRLSGAAPAVSISADVIIGNAVEKLRGLSDESCLIVVGTDVMGASRRTSGWSLGARLAGACVGPVAVVPDLGATERHGVVVGVDAESDDGALDFAAREALSRGQSLHLVHGWQRPATAGVSGLDPEFIEWLRGTHLEYLGAITERLLERYPALPVQQHLSEALPSVALHQFGAWAEVVVVGTRGFGAVRRFLRGSTSHALLLDISSPTVVVPCGSGA